MNDNQAPVLYRPRQGAVLGGVCAGIAARWRVDPLLVRVAMVVLALWGGVGVAVYLTGLLGLSRDPGRPSFVERRLPFTRRWTQSARLAAVFLAFAAVLAVSQHGVGGFFVPLLVVAGVVWMGGRKSRVAPPAEPTPFERAAAAWQQRVAEHQSRYGATTVGGQEVAWASPPSTPAPPAPQAPPSPRNRGWLLAAVLAAVGFGLLAVLAVLGVPLGATPWLAVALAALGLTLVFGSRGPRPAGMVLAAALLACATMTSAAAETRHGSTGSVVQVNPAGALAAGDYTRRDQTVAFRTAEDVKDASNHGVGSVTFDFSQLELDQDASAKVNFGVGEATIVLPKDVAYRLSWSVGAGEETDRHADGTAEQQQGAAIDGVADSAAGQGSGTQVKRPTLTLDFTMGAGELEVVYP